MAVSEVELIKSTISPEECSVEALPGLLAIFGGSLSSVQEITSGTAPKSFRDMYVQWLDKNDPKIRSMVLMPENYEDWNNFNVYSDLLLFEADLGYITSAIVIFLEAPGSIAELGAFSQIESLKDRLVIVVIDDRHPKKSFISLGPLRQLEEKDKDSVCVIPAIHPTELLNDIDVVNAAILKKMEGNKTKRAFNPNEIQHQFALAIDLISFIEVATFTDLKQLFEFFRVAVNDHRIQQILFTLEKSGLVQKRRYGGNSFYGPLTCGLKYLDYKGQTSDEKFNRARLQAKMLTNRDPSDRAKVFQKFFPKD